jgi:hypothetical protein
MRTTKLILYNRYAKNDKGETVKKVAEKFPRSLCLYNVLTEKDDKGNKRFKDFDTFIIASDKMYTDKNVNKESNIPETFRIWRIVEPVLSKLTTVPEFLK